MGNILRRAMCPIYPEPDSDDDSVDENRPLNYQIMDRGFNDAEEKYESINKILKPSEIIAMSKEEET